MATFDARRSELSEIFPDGRIGSYLEGRVVAGTGDRIDLVDPATGECFATYGDAGAEGAERAVELAQAGSQEWSAVSAEARAAILWKAAERLRERVQAFARLEAATAGKPVRDCVAEAGRVADMFAHYAGWCDKIRGEVIAVPSTHLNYTQLVPYGVVAQITPWNAPLFTAGWQLAPALAAGNAVVLKPSELTPVTSIMLARVLVECGVPARAVSVLAGYGRTAGTALVQQEAVRKVVFVGSVETGRRIAALAAGAPKPCVLELGGKSANVVFADADLDQAVAGAAAAIFGSAGQSCVAGSRLLVQRGVHDELVRRLVAKAQGLKLGDPLDPSTQIGPISNRPQFDKVCGLVGAARAHGNGVQAGGDRAEVAGFPGGLFYQPTVIGGVDAADPIAQEEVFGPVVAVIPFDDEEDAVRIANATPFGLAGAVWTRDVARAHRVAGRLNAGTVWINSYKTINVASPFGGFKASGYGRSSGREGLLEYLQVRSVWVETAERPGFQFGY